MEDSYTVHRRRKAAARTREKTPEPPRRLQDDYVGGTDEEEDARARMERMVQETERLEDLEESERRRVDAEKSGEHVVRSVAEKPQRSLKRAVSPAVRRVDEEISESGEKVEAKPAVEVNLQGIASGIKKSVVDSKESHKVTKKVSNTAVQDSNEQRKVIEDTVSPEMEESKPKKEEVDATGSSGVSSHISRRRTNSDKDLPKEKPARLSKKTLPPDAENQGIESEGNRMDKDKVRSDDARNRESGVSSERARKSSLRVSDDGGQEAAAALDENRYETAVAMAHENDAGPMRNVSGGKSERVKRHGSENDRAEGRRRSRELETSDKSSWNVEESVKHGKKDVTSPTKTRTTLESRSTVSATKRSGRDRNIAKTGYTTDSSETEETTKRALRRNKSPEVTKVRSTSSRKTPSRSGLTSDSDGDVDEREIHKKSSRRSASRRRPSSDASHDELELKHRTGSPSKSSSDKRQVPRAPLRQTDKWRTGESKRSSRTRNSSETDDDPRVIRKSGTFPVESSRNRSPSATRSSTLDIKKQIIPLSDDSLIEDFERAQREYLRKERGILDRDPLDDFVNPKMEAALRRRKFSIIQTESEGQDIAQQVVSSEKRSWFAWLPFFGKSGKKVKKEDIDASEINAPDTKISEDKKEETEVPQEILKQDKDLQKKVSFVTFFRTLGDVIAEFKAFAEMNPRETRSIRILRNRCIAELLLAIIYCGLGAFIFRFTEGAFETFYKCGVKRVKRDFLDSLWNFSHNMREEDWKSMARRKLMEFEEQLHTAHEAGVHSYSGQKSWSFLNAVVYCLTVITTIGYGHISPSTTTGRAITIVYAIFGIPMFLIILADFGKLFTRGIKFLWAFVRRLYYTGSCRRVRRTVPVQEVMKGVQLVYDLATFRRPSQINPEEMEEMQKQQNQTQTVLNLDGNAPPSAQPGTPGTPALSTFAIDDEFNLPISVAIVILLAYIFVGATVYNFWEQWGFFESFYFVFISMSTIGFGDYVPKHPIYMMLSIVYLVFGLALTSMCINVVQVMLSDSFKQASQKIGATIGFEVAEDDGSIAPAVPPPVELADVHTTIKESEKEEQIAPKAKQEDVEL